MSCKHKPRRTSQITVRTTLSNDQLHQLLKIASEGPGLQDLYDVASIVSYTGLRRGELENLRWSDVAFDKSRLIVDSPMSMSVRYLPFDAKSRRILESLRDRDPDPVFVLGRSPRQVLDRVRLQLRAVARKMGAGPVSLHSLRHSYFMRLLEAGADASRVMSIGGYRSSSLQRLFRVPLLTTAEAYERAMRDFARLP